MSPISPATAVLLRFLQTVPANAIVTADSWRLEADSAQLSTAERGAAPGSASRLGYLEPLIFRDHAGEPVMVGNKPVLGCVASDRELGKAGHVMVWTRTNEAIPAHLCQHVEQAS